MLTSVHDNGAVTNAAGVQVGELVEGDPKDLVGTTIKNVNENGQLEGESGSVLGKVDLRSEILEKTENATEIAGDNKDKESEAGEDTTVSPSYGVGWPHHFWREQDKVEGTEIPDLSILENLKVNKLGKVVDDKVCSIDIPQITLTNQARREHLWARLLKVISKYFPAKRLTQKARSGMIPVK